ncbi:hypothetical protein BGY98DRAFT_987906 [Russula aff. rugulosa BPL654]|nr:hypothetical protein BGY98DRAFT_987906 [Russula aff. rugulosa BPL654]
MHSDVMSYTIFSTIVRRFRILVVGKNLSGKSSLVNAVFRLDMPLGPEHVPGTADSDVDAGIIPHDNRHLVVHECPGFESGCDQNNLNISEFIERRTGENLSTSERLHAVWICVPTSDVIAKNLGDGVEEILSLNGVVPVILVATNSFAGGDTRLYERARGTAHAKYEESRRSLFRGKLRDVPVEIVSTEPRYDDLLERLIMTTHKLIMANSRNTSMLSISSETLGGNLQINPVSFALSVEQRVNYNLIIQASIDRSLSRIGYWRSLWSSHDFADQPLGNCIDVVHTDIVDVWKLRDSDGYLSSTEFKTKMSDLVKTLAEPLTTAPPRPKGNTPPCGRQASMHEACNLYRNSIENIRYMVGYIVDLTIILHGLFVSTHDDVSACKVQEVMNHHVESGLQKRIHHDVRRFITDEGLFTYRGNDLVVEKMIDLIKNSVRFA